MFKMSLFGRIVSDEGYWVKYSGPATVLYRAGSVAATVGCDRPARGSALVLYRNQVCSDSNATNRIDDAVLVDSILKRTRAAFEYIGYEVEVR